MSTHTRTHTHTQGTHTTAHTDRKQGPCSCNAL